MSQDAEATTALAPLIDLSGKVALVPGASGAMGSAVGEVLAECGATVVLGYNQNAAKAEEVLARAKALGRPARADRIDATRLEDVQRWVDQVLAGYGQIDVIANCVGWHGHESFKLFTEQSPEGWRELVDIELMATVYFAHVAIHHMMERGYGRIVTVGSDSSKVGESGAAVSAAARGGINAFSKSLAREVGRHNITVNTVCPGPTEGPALDRLMQSGDVGEKIIKAVIRAIPMKRVATAREVANVVAFLASDAASFMTGQAISVSGGLTMN